MKSKFTLTLLILLPFFGVKAQLPILVSEDSLKFGKSMLPALSVTIPEAGYEKTLKAWTKELQTKTKSKVMAENMDLSIFGALIKEISPNPINVYSRIETIDSMLMLIASFEIKKDEYISRDMGADFEKAQVYLKGFAKTQYIDVVKDQVDAEDKVLRNIEKELSSLENEKSRMQKSIQSNLSSIASEKENIIIQNNELATVSLSLVEQNNLLSTMEAGPAYKEKEVLIKDLEKRKRKAQNSKESSENKIDKANNDISKTNGEIPVNERMQEKVKDQIAQQKAVCQQFADKLKKIKAY